MSRFPARILTLANGWVSDTRDFSIAVVSRAQALVQREQLKEELDGMRRRMEQHAEDMSVKMAQERDLVRKENKLERDELSNKVQLGEGVEKHTKIHSCAGKQNENQVFFLGGGGHVE